MWLDFAVNMGLGYCMTGGRSPFVVFRDPLQIEQKQRQSLCNWRS
jgi:hypothetical protein